MFTPATGFPAFQCTGGLPASGEGNAMTRTSRDVTVRLAKAFGSDPEDSHLDTKLYSASQ